MTGPLHYRLRISRFSWTGESTTREVTAILAAEPHIGDRIDTLETTGRVTGRVLTATGVLVCVEECGQ